jgi:bacillithiol biosynthesis cysteine-adding enzyme BshC
VAADAQSTAEHPLLAADPSHRLRVELAPSGLLPPLPRAFVEGRDLDLLAPVRFLAPGAAPEPRHDAAAADRRDLAAGLSVANRSYGHPKAEELAAKLADPATRVVVAGQQPGLLGGPLYTFSKALAAARWAAELEAAGQPAVAVFWVATEDHDWHEVSRATLLTHRGPLELDLGDDPDPLTPVGMRCLGPRVREVLAAAREAMHGDRYDAWLDEVERWYRPDARFGEAFSRLMVALLGEHCPLLLDSMLPAVKAAQRPWLARLVERRDETEAAFAGADAAIEERGYPHQVHPQRGVSPLFLYQHGQRRRVAWTADGDGYELRGEEDGSRSVARLLETIEENPVAVSPGVLARPVVQDAILGTDLMVLGPGELSYLPQVAPLYDVLGVATPQVALRPQVLVLESHQIDKLDEVELTLAELLAPRTTSSACWRTVPVPTSPPSPGAAWRPSSPASKSPPWPSIRTSSAPWKRPARASCAPSRLSPARSARRRRGATRCAPTGWTSCATRFCPAASCRSGWSARPTTTASTGTASRRATGSRWSSTARCCRW